jgi:hypothetical protein
LGANWGRAILASGCMLVFTLGGCGTYVPDLQEWPNNNYVGSVLLIHAIVRSVECSLKHAVTNVVNADVTQAPLHASHRAYTDFLNDWGAEVAFTFTIVEKSGANPGAVWKPVTPLTSVFTWAATRLCPRTQPGSRSSTSSIGSRTSISVQGRTVMPAAKIPAVRC